MRQKVAQYSVKVWVWD